MEVAVNVVAPAATVVAVLLLPRVQDPGGSLNGGGSFAPTFGMMSERDEEGGAR